MAKTTPDYTLIDPEAGPWSTAAEIEGWLLLLRIMPESAERDAAIRYAEKLLIRAS